MDDSPMMHRLKEGEDQFGREDNDVLLFLQGHPSTVTQEKQPFGTCIKQWRTFPTFNPFNHSGM